MSTSPTDIPTSEPAAAVVPAPSHGSRLNALMADHDRGAQYALVQCVGAGFTCSQETRIEESKFLSDDEIAARLHELGWSVKPTLCPKHNISKGQVPLPLPGMAR